MSWMRMRQRAVNKKKKKRGNRRRREPFLKRAAHRLAVALKAGLALALVSFIVYGSWWTYEQVISTPRLAVRHLSVSGALRAQPREIIRLAGIEEGQNIFSFSSSKVVRRIGENPWVLETAVHRKLPGTVKILVKERRPMAIVKKMKGLFVMDSSGKVFKKLASGDSLDLPLVTGLGRDAAENKSALMAPFLRLFSILENRDGFNIENVSEVHCDSDYGFTLYTLDDGLRLELGREDFEARLSLFERLKTMKKGLLRGVAAVDLRKYGEAVVRYDKETAKAGGRV